MLEAVLIVVAILILAWAVLFLGFHLRERRDRALAEALASEYECLHCSRKSLRWYGHRWREQEGILGFRLVCGVCGCGRDLHLAQARWARKRQKKAERRQKEEGKGVRLGFYL
jgi:hypothetical protein